MAQGFAKYLCVQSVAHGPPQWFLRTTAKDAQRNRTFFSCGSFALDVWGAAHFGYLEKTGDIAQVGSYFVANGGVVIRQHVQALRCGGFEPKKRT